MIRGWRRKEEIPFHPGSQPPYCHCTKRNGWSFGLSCLSVNLGVKFSCCPSASEWEAPLGAPVITGTDASRPPPLSWTLAWSSTDLTICPSPPSLLDYYKIASWLPNCLGSISVVESWIRDSHSLCFAHESPSHMAVIAYLLFCLPH